MPDETKVVDLPAEAKEAPPAAYSVSDQHSSNEEGLEFDDTTNEDAARIAVLGPAEAAESWEDGIEKPEKPEDEPGEQEEPDAEVDPELLAFAKDVGIPEGVAETLGKAGDLEELLEAKVFANVAPEGDEPVSAPEKPASEVKDEKVKADEPDPDDGLDGDLYDPDLVKYIRAERAERLQAVSKVKELEEAMEGMAEMLLERRDRDDNDAFDVRIADLGEDYETLFGKGPSSALDPKSDHHKNRKKLFFAEKQVELTLGELGINVPPQELSKRARFVTFGDEERNMTRRKVAGAAKKSRAGRSAPRPNARKAGETPQLTSDEEGWKALNEAADRMGLPDDDMREPDEINRDARNRGPDGKFRPSY